jgi:hypothetical protein
MENDKKPLVDKEQDFVQEAAAVFGSENDFIEKTIQKNHIQFLKKLFLKVYKIKKREREYLTKK